MQRAATRTAAERGGSEFSAGPPQAEFKPPRGAATRTAAERGGSEFSAGLPQAEFKPPRGAATRAAAERGGSTSLKVLHLFAHLFNQHFHVDRNARELQVGRFGAQGVGFPVQFLNQKVQPLTQLSAFFQQPLNLAQM